MKKSLASLFVAAMANVLIAIPAIASSTGPSFYAPSFDEGGCRDAGYNEYDNVYYYDWAIPALSDGESITVTPTLYWNTGGSPQGTPPSGGGYEYTFTCNNGTLSSPEAGAPWGSWL